MFQICVSLQPPTEPRRQQVLLLSGTGGSHLTARVEVRLVRGSAPDVEEPPALAQDGVGQVGPALVKVVGHSDARLGVGVVVSDPQCGCGRRLIRGFNLRPQGTEAPALRASSQRSGTLKWIKNDRTLVLLWYGSANF